MRASLGLSFSRLLKSGSAPFLLDAPALSDEVACLAAVVAGATTATLQLFSATKQRSSAAAACMVALWSRVAAAVTLSVAAQFTKTTLAAMRATHALHITASSGVDLLMLILLHSNFISCLILFESSVCALGLKE